MYRIFYGVCARERCLNFTTLLSDVYVTTVSHYNTVRTLWLLTRY